VIRDGERVPLAIGAAHVQVESDGESVIVDATHELILRCGSASITLSKNGKVVIRGTYVSTTSTGVNRLKGGSIEIN
jgi:hypothetical protein